MHVCWSISGACCSSYSPSVFNLVTMTMIYTFHAALVAVDSLNNGLPTICVDWPVSLCKYAFICFPGLILKEFIWSAKHVYYSMHSTLLCVHGCRHAVCVGEGGRGNKGWSKRDVKRRC